MFEGHEIGRPEFLEAGGHDRQFQVAVAHGPAVAGDVLDDRQHATRQHALRDRAPEHRDFGRIVRIGPVADDPVSAGGRHVQHRKAVDIDPDGSEIVRHPARRQAHERSAFFRLQVDISVEVGGRRILRPDRRAHPLDAAALLIDQHGRIFSPDN